MEDIAIVGISCLIPGAKGPDEFWQNLMQNKNLLSGAGRKQYADNPELYKTTKKGETDKCYCTKGGYVSDIDFDFNLKNLSISTDEIEKMDDLYKWSLYTAYEALKDSKYHDKPNELAKCGIVLANLSFPTKYSNQLYLPIYYHALEEELKSKIGVNEIDINVYKAHSNVSDANRHISGFPSSFISKALALSEVHFTIDAACASTIYAIKLACDYLRNHKASIMLAGAVSAADPLFVSMGFSIFQALPENQTTSPLDSDSQGLIASEGAGFFVLKRMKDAIKDKDKIYAAIRGIGLSNDGRGASVLSPNSRGQVAAFERAYSNSSIKPEDIQYIECHATGTPLGDKIELDSIENFFGKNKISPYLGSVKSNVGHLLTAAGVAGLIKVILSMQKGVIPATINVKTPLISKNKNIGGDKIVTSNTSWPDSKANKHAAINTFGFGGSNAHLILSNGIGLNHTEKRLKTANVQNPSKVAIVGMDAHFGNCSSLDQLHKSIHDASQHFIKLPSDRWKGIEHDHDLLKKFNLDRNEIRGAFIEDFSVDFMRLRIPPNNEDRLIPQQLLAIKVADNAIKQAKLKEGDNVTVIVAMEAELSLHQYRGRVNLASQFDQFFSSIGEKMAGNLKDQLMNASKDSLQSAVKINQYTSYIGNIMACRISSVWDFSGPAFTVSSEENSVFRALEVAQLMLDNNETNAVVISAVDLSGSLENVLYKNKEHKINTGNYSISIEKDTNGWLIGEGAGAIVVKKLETAVNDKNEIFAVVESLKFSNEVTKKSVTRVFKSTLDDLKINPSDVKYIEYSSTGQDDYDRIELEVFSEIFNCQTESACAIGSIKSNIGHTGAASGMAAIIKNALCIYNKFIPPTPNWNTSKHPEITDKSSLYIPTESIPWFLTSANKRFAAISNISSDDTYCNLMMSGYDNAVVANENIRYRTISFPHLIVCAAENQLDLIESLKQIQLKITENTLTSIVAEYASKFCNNSKNRYRIAIIGNDTSEVSNEINDAIQIIPGAISARKEWISVKGSCFYPNSESFNSKVAFVYPGGFNTYIGLGKETFQLFPELYELVKEYNSNIGDVIHQDLIYPKSKNKLSEIDIDNLNEKLADNPIAMFESGVTFSVLYTLILQKILGVNPDVAFGYSMGEVSMLHALGVWKHSEQMSKVLRESPVFNTRLAGNMETLREAWNIPEDNLDIWHVYTLKCTSNSVNKAISKYKKVFILVINTPNELVIGGDGSQCLNLIKELSCQYTKISMTDTVHCEIAKPEFENLSKLHTAPVNKINNIDFYTASNFSKLEIESNVIAKNIATIYSNTIDFPHLVETIYSNGISIFIELGARGNCSSWIDEILKDKEHIAIPINRKNISDKFSIIRLVAKLFSLGVPMQLNKLFPYIDQKEQGHSLVLSTKNGSTPIASVLSSGKYKPVIDAVKNKLVNPPSEMIINQEFSKESGHHYQPSQLGGIFSKNIPAELMETKVVTNSLKSFYIDNLNKIYEHTNAVSQIQLEYLRLRSSSQKVLTDLLHHELSHIGSKSGIFSHSFTQKTEQAVAFTATNVETIDLPSANSPSIKNEKKGVVWDKNDLMEFAEGRISKVFGPEYSIIDTYSRRVRLPIDPYLLVTRVTKISAKTNEYKPSTITTEYDIPYNAWYSVEGQIPWAVSVESGQCDLLLISYLGIDFENKGEKVYRLLDSTLTFLDTVPKEGETLRYDIKIDSFSRSGESLLFFFSYECFVKDKKVLVMNGGCAGFFTDAELNAGKGVIYSERELATKKKIEKKAFSPFLKSTKNSFDKTDLLNLVKGNVSECFGKEYAKKGQNQALHFSVEKMLMIDRISNIDSDGGSWGLGKVVAEKDLRPDQWFFPCHFKDDQVLAGSLMAEGCAQIMKFYLYYLGMQTLTSNARFEPISNKPMKVRCRGQVTPVHSLLKYVMEVKEIGLYPEPFATADIEIIFENRIVVHFQDLGVRLLDHEPKLNRPLALFDHNHIEQFATGSIAKCFGDEYKIYENRQAPRTPNSHLQLISRVISIDGEKKNFKSTSKIISEYDAPFDAWYFLENSHPSEMPYSILMEIALQPCGFLSAYIGSSFIYPQLDFYFRNLDGKGSLVKKIDLRGKTITNVAKLLSTNAFANTILQSFTFELSAEKEIFYSGTAVFGYFIKDALINQLGLDNGKSKNPFSSLDKSYETIKLTNDKTSLYYLNDSKPHYLLAQTRLDFLDEVFIVENGGKFNNGYICAYKNIHKDDWYFACHFYGDPVMPGSLGVESIIQSIQAYAIHAKLGSTFYSPCFTVTPNSVSWKYRGQIVPDNERMDLEVHIKEIQQSETKVTIICEASIWKKDIRIYEVNDIAICIVEEQNKI